MCSCVSVVCVPLPTYRCTVQYSAGQYSTVQYCSVTESLNSANRSRQKPSLADTVKRKAYIGNGNIIQYGYRPSLLITYYGFDTTHHITPPQRVQQVPHYAGITYCTASITCQQACSCWPVSVSEKNSNF